MQRIALRLRQLGHRLAQLAGGDALLALKAVGGGELVGRGDLHLAPAAAAVAAQPVHRAAFRDGSQPGTEGAGGVVGGADLVQRQQRVLHGVLGLGGVLDPAPADRADQRQALAQQRVIGARIAPLRRRHQRRPAQIAYVAAFLGHPERTWDAEGGKGVTHAV